VTAYMPGDVVVWRNDERFPPAGGIVRLRREARLHVDHWDVDVLAGYATDRVFEGFIIGDGFAP